MQTRRQADFCRKLRAPVLGVVENMSGFVCECCGHALPSGGIFGGSSAEQAAPDSDDGDGASAGAALAAQIGCELLARVPLDPRLALSGDEGQCLLCAHPEAPASKALEKLCDAVIKRLP